jgi:hypothetical protein
MARPKRHIDTDIWNHAWFASLEQPLKLLWFYIWSKADFSGCWKVKLEDAAQATSTKAKLDPAEVLVRLNQNELGVEDPMPRIIPIMGGRKWWVRGYMHFHYANVKTYKLILNDRSLFHQRILRDVETNGLTELLDKYYPGWHVSKPLVQHRMVPIPTLEEFRAMPESVGMSDFKLQTFWGHWNSKGWRCNQEDIQDYPSLLLDWQGQEKVEKEIASLGAQKFGLLKEKELKPGATIPSITQAASEKIKEINLRIDGLKLQAAQQLGGKRK